MSSPVQIVFGTGPLGRATAAALLDAGHTVTIASRSGTMIAPPLGAKIAAVDLRDVASTTTACRGAVALYFCAAPSYQHWAREFPALLDGAVAAAQATGARLVVADNLYAYGQVNGSMSETLPLRPNSGKGRVRANMHQRLIAAREVNDLEFVSARGSDFYGPWVAGSAVGSRLIEAISAGKDAVFLGKTDQPHSFTYVGDFGRALATLGTAKAVANQVWHVPNAPPVTLRRFVEIVAEIAETSSRVRTASRFEQNVIGLFVPALREGLEMRYQFDRPFIVDHARFAKSFGDVWTTLEAGIQSTLTWACERRSPPSPLSR